MIKINKLKYKSIIFEGPNNCGKSTLIKMLKKDLDEYNFIHFGPPEKFVVYKSSFIIQEYNEIYKQLELMKISKNINIFDRSAFGGTFYYGIKYRRYDVDDIIGFKNFIKKYHPKNDYVYIIVKRNLDKLKEYYDRNFIQYDEIEEDYNYYYFKFYNLLLNDLNIKNVLFLDIVENDIEKTYNNLLKLLLKEGVKE